MSGNRLISQDIYNFICDQWQMEKSFCRDSEKSKINIFDLAIFGNKYI